MKKRIIYIMLTIFVLFSLSSCGLSNAIRDGAASLKKEAKEGAEELKDAADEGKEAAKKAGSKKPKKSDNTKDKDSEAKDAAGSGENNDEDTSEEETPMWKTLYYRLLDRLREDLSADGSTTEYTPIGYYLYDIDKDGIPEMIVKRGTCEADYNADIFVNDGYSAKPIEYGVGVGHTVFYSDPDENGILFNWGHMGSQEVWVEKVENDQVVEGESLFSETLDESHPDYTPITDIVPGATRINECGIAYNIYVTEYETILAGMEGKLTDQTDRKHPDQKLSDAVDNVIDYGGAVVNSRVADYGYGEDLGTIPFDELLKKADAYAEAPYEIESREYGDLNGDGRQECVLYLKNQDDENRRMLCIMNLQDGKMYAYTMTASFDDRLTDDGSFEQNMYDGEKSHYRLVFDHDECMAYWLD